MRLTLIVVSATVVLSAACGRSPGSPERIRSIAIIATPAQQTPDIQISTQSPGRAYVRVVSFAPDACYTKGDSEVVIYPRGLVAGITPFDVRSAQSDGACIAQWQMFVHVDTLQFDRPGLAHIVVRGKGVGLPFDVEVTKDVQITIEGVPVTEAGR